MLFTIKLYLHLNSVLILNWIVWNRTIFIKMDLALNNLQRLICHKTQQTKTKTKWPEMFILKNTNTRCIITVLKLLFSRQVLPVTLVSDNRSQLTLDRLRHFCYVNCVTRVRSPPYYPLSNGPVKRFVGTSKCTLLNAHNEGTTKETLQTFWYIAQAWNVILKERKSPAEALMGRKFRTTLRALRPQQKQVQDQQPQKIFKHTHTHTH